MRIYEIYFNIMSAGKFEIISYNKRIKFKISNDHITIGGEEYTMNVIYQFIDPVYSYFILDIDDDKCSYYAKVELEKLLLPLLRAEKLNELI